MILYSQKPKQRQTEFWAQQALKKTNGLNSMQHIRKYVVLSWNHINTRIRNKKLGYPYHCGPS